jgi:hypothetical protein
MYYCLFCIYFSLFQEHCALAWANIRLINRNDKLTDHALTLHLWPFPKDFVGFVYPMGHNGSNPTFDTSRLDVSVVVFYH